SASAEKIFSRFSATELTKQHQAFIIKAEGKIEKQSPATKGKKAKASTLDLTLKLWQEGKSIAEIAKERSLSENTVFSHIVDLIKSKKIISTEISRLISPKLKPEIHKINEAFKKLKTTKLTPIFNFFSGKYSYDEIKIALLTKDLVQ
ncbi:MAG: helix-turn-helix domain-containing protein, partial [Candidatus Berkelbacteria bacterium]